MLTRLFLAIIAGALIGWDRERKKKPTGIRTSSLLCMGVCLFTIVAQLMPSSYIDRGHIAANIPQGVGMICALAVIADPKKNHIIGLTSSVILWALAAIGMAIGFGFYGIAFEAVGLILIVVYLTDWAQDRGLFTGDRK